MRPVFGAFCALLALCGPLAAQSSDAFVLPRGMARVRIGGAFTQFNSRFAPNGGTEALSADLQQPLTAARFAPLRPLETELSRFLTATQPQAGTPMLPSESTLLLGTPTVELEANVREVPLEVALGVAPRVEISLRLPLWRQELLLQRLELAGGTVGVNADSGFNARLLAGVDERWRALGAGGLLPVAGSALGEELQRRVRALTGGSQLRLPETAAGTPVLERLLREQFGPAALRSGLGAWEMGDVEASARVRLPSSMGDAAYPLAPSDGIHYRGAATLGVRLPTGATSDSVRLFDFIPQHGRAGWHAGLNGDVFVGSRFWATLSARFAAGRPVTVSRRLVPPGEPLSSITPPQPVTWHPGSELQLQLEPRYRLTEEISLGVQYAYLSTGASRFQSEGAADASALDTSAGSVQALGAGVRYSTLPAYADAQRLLPLEISLSYQAVLSGAERSPVSHGVWLQASLFHPVWGRR